MYQRHVTPSSKPISHWMPLHCIW